MVEVVVPVTRDAPLRVVGHGVVAPRATVVVSAQVSGEVVEVGPHFVAGGTLERGELLLRLDPRRYRAAVDQAAGDLRAASAELEFSESQVVRLEQLVAESLVQQESLDAEISRRNRLLGQIAALDAARRGAELDLEQSVIRAPFDGKVLSEAVDVGDIVAPGSVLAQIFPTDSYEVVVALGDDEARLIPNLWDTDAAGPPVVIATDYGGMRLEWDGFVHRVEAGLDQRARTINVVLRVPEPNRPGACPAALAPKRRPSYRRCCRECTSKPYRRHQSGPGCGSATPRAARRFEHLDRRCGRPSAHRAGPSTAIRRRRCDRRKQRAQWRDDDRDR